MRTNAVGHLKETMWPFKKKHTFENWPIVRSRPVGRTYGRSISLFINNWQCHLTTVDVYEDGSIDCWGFVDRDLFRGKLQSRWVVPAPNADQKLSVFNFGFTGVSDGRWLQTSHSIAKEVEFALRALNPEMEDLVDMQGSDTEVRGKVRYAKLGLSDKKPYRRDSIGTTDILGDSVPILRVIGDAFELTRLVIYADGVCQIASDGEFVPIRELAELYESGRICNTAASGSRIVLPGLGEFSTTTDFGSVSRHDRIREIYDKLNELNGKPSIVTTCAKLFERYDQDPSLETKQALLEAYEAVPDHLRCYCGDMDTRDTAIRAVLYGDDA